MVAALKDAQVTGRQNSLPRLRFWLLFRCDILMSHPPSVCAYMGRRTMSAGCREPDRPREASPHDADFLPALLCRAADDDPGGPRSCPLPELPHFLPGRAEVCARMHSPRPSPDARSARTIYPPGVRGSDGGAADRLRRRRHCPGQLLLWQRFRGRSVGAACRAHDSLVSSPPGPRRSPASPDNRRRHRVECALPYRSRSRRGRSASRKRPS
jgi:hypothetical protein